MPESTHPNRRAASSLIKVFWSAIKGYLMGVGLLVTLLPVILSFFIFNSQKDLPDRSSHSKLDSSKKYALTMDLDGVLTESAPRIEQQIIQKIFGGPKSNSLSAIKIGLRRAAKDDRIEKVKIRVTSLSASKTTFTEFSNYLLDFKKSGKQIEVWLSSADSNLYSLASSADKIILAPGGHLDLPGPLFQLVYFKNLLEKIGVEFQVIRTGQYKSAFEPLTTNEPSQATLEMYQSLESDLRNHLVAGVSSGRKRSLDEVGSWFIKSSFNADEALESGLVDAIGFGQDLNDPDSSNESVGFTKYLSQSEAIDQNILANEEEGIGLIIASGEILLDDTGSGANDDSITPAEMKKQIRWATDDQTVKSVVLRISSPGGSALASDLIWQDLKILNSKKPVVVSMGDVAASGGYYIATPATKILADPNTITGSIGVIGALPNLQAFQEKFGVTFHVISQSSQKNLLNPGSRATDADLEPIRQSIDKIYDLFLSRVSESRGMPKERVDELGQGRVYTGNQALTHKLIDQIGGLQEAFDVAKELAGFDPNKLYPIHNYKNENLDLRECVSSLKKLFDCAEELDSKLLLKFSLSAIQRDFGAGIEGELMRRLNRMRNLIRQDKFLSLWTPSTGLWDSSRTISK